MKKLAFSINNNKIANHLDVLWDKLSDYFNTHKEKELIHPDAAVNIFVGWPLILNLIKDYSKNHHKNKLTVMDFGCGAGEFCKKLDKLGHKVYGMDHSNQMVKIAVRKNGRRVKIIKSNHVSEIFSKKSYMGKFDVITSIHSLEWIRDIEVAMDNLLKLLKENGMFILAVFPKEHIVDSLKIKDLFEDFDSDIDPKTGYANFNGIRVPVFIRDADFFDNYFQKKNFIKVTESYPEYPEDFFKKYKWTGSKYPEMMILAYRRNPELTGR